MAVIKRMSSKANVGKLEKYLKQEDKTEEKLISATNCDCEDFAKQCEITNAFYNKNQNQNDRKYYHIIQSFSPKDNEKLTHEQAHKIGVEFAEKNFKGFEVLVVTHKDKEHIHNHFVVNSVSLENGKKYRADNKSLWQLRRTSNELCQQNNLINSIQPLEKRAKEKINDAEIRGKESWQGNLKRQIIEVSKNAISLDDFRKKLNEKYNVETQIVTRTRKGEKEEILEYKPKGNRKFFDGQRRLGTEFGKEYIHELTRRNAEKERGRTETEPRTDTSSIEDAIRNRQAELINADIEHRKRELEKSNIEHERDRERENQKGTGVAEPKNRIEPAKEKPTYKPRTR
jgi:hypothetical protein